jgi:hypothetical protein
LRPFQYCVLQFQNPVDPYWPNGTLLFGVEDGPLPNKGDADDRVMPCSYRLCVTTDTENQVPWPSPPNYNEGDFELLIRYANSLSTTGQGSPSVQDFIAMYDYNGYPSNSERSMRYDLCEVGSSAVSSDEPTPAYDAYIVGNRTVRAAVASQVKYWVAGMMYTLANSESIPSATRASAAAWGLCKDAWPTNGNWPPQLYVREGVRIVGDTVWTQNSLIKGQCFPDSIAIGGWTIDIHIVRRFVGEIGGKLSAQNEGEVGFANLPGNGSTYDMSYSLLLPKRAEATNLLVPVCPSSTHVSFGSIRVEPSFTQLGTAAGVAAALAWSAKVAVQDVPIAALQGALVAAGQCIHWPNCSAVNECGSSA